MTTPNALAKYFLSELATRMHENIRFGQDQHRLPDEEARVSSDRRPCVRPPSSDERLRHGTCSLDDMTDTLELNGLPETLRSVRTRPLFVMRLDVRPLLVIGRTPDAFRRIGIVPGGMFEGDRLRGIVNDGGSDWQNVRGDGSTTLDVRLALETDSGDTICMTYRGVRSGAADVIAQLETGTSVDPSTYYFRINPMFETASPRYEWLNRILAIGVGYRRADGPIYSLFEVL